MSWLDKMRCVNHLLSCVVLYLLALAITFLFSWRYTIISQFFDPKSSPVFEKLVLSRYTLAVLCFVSAATDIVFSKSHLFKIISTENSSCSACGIVYYYLFHPVLSCGGLSSPRAFWQPEFPLRF